MFDFVAIQASYLLWLLRNQITLISVRIYWTGMRALQAELSLHVTVNFQNKHMHTHAYTRHMQADTTRRNSERLLILLRCDGEVVDSLHWRCGLGSWWKATETRCLKFLRSAAFFRIHYKSRLKHKKEDFWINKHVWQASWISFVQSAVYHDWLDAGGSPHLLFCLIFSSKQIFYRIWTNITKSGKKKKKTKYYKKT